MENESWDILSGDALIHCEITGPKQAPALVLLHGNAEDLHIFDRLTVRFSKDYRTIAVDTRGHGKSERGTRPFTFHTFASDLITVLDTLGVDRANIIGFSDGANTALHMALIAPERIRSMILLGANYHPQGLCLRPRLLIRSFYALLSLIAFCDKKVIPHKEMWGLMAKQPKLTLKELTQITIPTLVVTGEYDMVRQSHNDKLCHAIKGAKRLIHPRGNHFWPFKYPDVFDRYATDFFRDN